MLSVLGGVGQYIIPFLGVLTLLVFIHELGHYLVARWNGIQVDVFSIGFGPELFGWTDRAQTRWKISLIPLGGYVRMYGDADASSRSDSPTHAALSSEEKAKTMMGKTIPQKMAVVVAGPVANYLFAFVIMVGLFVFQGRPVLTNEVGGVVEGGVAHSLGIRAKDRLIEINGIPTDSFEGIRTALAGQEGKKISIKIQRQEVTAETLKNEKGAHAPGIPSTLIVTGKMVVMPENQPTKTLGVLPGGKEYVLLSVADSISSSLNTLVFLSWETLKGIGQMIVGNRSSGELVGILGMGEMAGQSAQAGWASLLWFMAVLSLNLGFVNLLPIPVLDGGHLVLYSIEALRGKPLAQKTQDLIFMVGLAMVVGTMLLSTKNDLSRFNVFQWFSAKEK